MTLDEERAKEFFDRTTLYDGKSFTCQLPFKEGGEKLPDNINAARRRFFAMEKRWTREPKAKEECQKTIRKYLEAGIVRECTKKELQAEEGKFWYLSYHLVKKKSEEKWRVVFDGAAEFLGKSLNQQLLAGPKLQTDLFNIIMRFRRFKVTLSADISQMFTNIKLTEEASQFCRFLFRENPDEMLKVFLFVRVIFGLKSSPFQAIACLLALAERFDKEFPEAGEQLRDSTYVDDILASFMDEQEAIKTAHDLINLLKRGNFPLMKFNSNSTTLLKTIEADRLAKEACTAEDLPTASHSLPEERTSSMKALGLEYDLGKDTFKYDLGSQLKKWLDTEQWTRRKTLSCLAGVFDPVGLVQPYIGGLKVLNQSTWKHELGWDDPLPEETQVAWRKELERTAALPEVEFDRHLHLDYLREDGSRAEVVVTCDASEKLYGVAIYCRVFRLNGSGEEECVSSNLVMCRSRVAPLKKELTIPRLELLGCLIAVRATTELLKEWKLPKEWEDKVSVKYYTDSAIALGWIKQEKTKYYVFVENRVKEIREKSNPNDWGHVKGEQNPADFPTRGDSPWKTEDFHTVWSKGPEWLRTGKEPEKGNIVLSGSMKEIFDSEKRREADIFSSQAKNDEEKEEFMKRLFFSVGSQRSKWGRAIRKIALMRSWKKGGEKGREQMSPLTAEKMLLRLIQEVEFPDELVSLNEKKDVADTSRLKKLAPYLDEHGIMRAHSRIHEDRENDPIILGKCDGVKHLIMSEHHRLFHARQERLLDHLRAKFWILHARASIKHVLKMCALCIAQDRMTMEPHMARLPAFRTSFRGVWNMTVGADFAGPFLVNRAGNPQKKVYVLVFVDAAIRLLTLIPTLDMTTNAVVQGVEEYCATRGTPQQIISDNGASLVAADKTLKDIFRKVNWNDVKTHFSSPNETLEWKFLPAFSPWMGGMYERFVKAFKHSLNKVFLLDIKKLQRSQNNLTWEEFGLALKKVESVINDRPLTVVTSEEEFDSPLTPSLLAFGQRMLPLPHLNRKPEDSLQKAYKQRSLLTKHFTTIWRERYLRALTPYATWASKSRSVRRGDVVQVVDKNSSKGWRLGIIEKCVSTSGLNPVTVEIRTRDNQSKQTVKEVVAVRRLKLVEANEEPDDGAVPPFQPHLAARTTRRAGRPRRAPRPDVGEKQGRPRSAEGHGGGNDQQERPVHSHPHGTRLQKARAAAAAGMSTAQDGTALPAAAKGEKTFSTRA